MKKRIKFVQEQLNRKGLNVGDADGIIGKKTHEALNAVKGLPSDWPDEKKVVGYIQLLCQEKGINGGTVDGFWGPQTKFGFESLQHLIKKGSLPKPWREEDKIKDTPEKVLDVWPRQTLTELNSFYGQVGENQTKIQLPYPHKIAWDTKTIITGFSCHKKVHDSMNRVLSKVFNHYGLEKIKALGLDLWGGCLNVRQMRGGTSYSTHSWGIAVDYDPAHNGLKLGRDKANFAKPEYDKWWEFWEEEGWVSLGRVKNYDWMHVQAAKP